MSDKYRYRYKRWQRLLEKDPAKAAHNKKFMIRNAKRDLKKLKDAGESPDPWLQKIVSESETRRGKVTPAHTAAHSAGIAPGTLKNLLTAGSVVIPGLAGVKIVKGAGNIFKVFKDGKQIGGNYRTGRSAINYVKDKFKNIITPRKGPSVARQPGTEAENLAAVARARAGQRGSRFDRAATGRTATQDFATAADKRAALRAAKKGLRHWEAINKSKPGGWKAAWKDLSARKKAALLAGTGLGVGIGVNEVAKLLGSDSKVGVARSRIYPEDKITEYSKTRKALPKIDWDRLLKGREVVPYGGRPSTRERRKADKSLLSDPKFYGGVATGVRPPLKPWEGGVRYKKLPDWLGGGEIKIDSSPDVFNFENPDNVTHGKKGGQVKKGLKKTKTKPRGVGAAKRGWGCVSRG